MYLFNNCLCGDLGMKWWYLDPAGNISREEEEPCEETAVGTTEHAWKWWETSLSCGLPVRATLMLQTLTLAQSMQKHVCVFMHACVYVFHTCASMCRCVSLCTSTKWCRSFLSSGLLEWSFRTKAKLHWLTWNEELNRPFSGNLTLLSSVTREWINRWWQFVCICPTPTHTDTHTYTHTFPQHTPIHTLTYTQYTFTQYTPIYTHLHTQNTHLYTHLYTH